MLMMQHFVANFSMFFYYVILILILLFYFILLHLSEKYSDG